MSIEKLIQEYKDLEIEQSLNYIEFNKILITSHSTRIEGSTLTLNETRILIEDGNTPSGKPLIFSNQTKDHYEALNFVLEQAKAYIYEIHSRNRGESDEEYRGSIL